MQVLNINGFYVVPDKISAWSYGEQIDGITKILHLFLVGDNTPLMLKIDATEEERLKLQRRIERAVYGY